MNNKNKHTIAVDERVAVESAHDVRGRFDVEEVEVGASCLVRQPALVRLDHVVVDVVGQRLHLFDQFLLVHCRWQMANYHAESLRDFSLRFRHGDIMNFSLCFLLLSCLTKIYIAYFTLRSSKGLLVEVQL